MRIDWLEETRMSIKILFNTHICCMVLIWTTSWSFCIDNICFWCLLFYFCSVPCKSHRAEPLPSSSAPSSSQSECSRQGWAARRQNIDVFSPGSANHRFNPPLPCLPQPNGARWLRPVLLPRVGKSFSQPLICKIGGICREIETHRNKTKT